MPIYFNKLSLKKYNNLYNLKNRLEKFILDNPATIYPNMVCDSMPFTETYEKIRSFPTKFAVIYDTNDKILCEKFRNDFPEYSFILACIVINKTNSIKHQYYNNTSPLVVDLTYFKEYYCKYRDDFIIDNNTCEKIFSEDFLIGIINNLETAITYVYIFIIDNLIYLANIITRPGVII